MDQFNDEHSGKGGSYLIGEDGKRVLQERTEMAAVPAEQPSTSKTGKKGVSDGKSN